MTTITSNSDISARGFTQYSISGNGGNDTIVSAGPFVGTVATGNGNVGGRLGIRVSPATAAHLIEVSLLPRLRLVELKGEDMMEAIRGSNAVGVRGGALYDFLHLIVARHSAVKILYTLNARHFETIVRKGDPNIALPD